MIQRVDDDAPNFGSAARKIKKGQPVLRFKIELPLEDAGRTVLVWRIIETPYDYTFWDLHVAIQDAMGWADYHLHEFTVPTNPVGPGTIKLGIPIDEFDVPEIEIADGSVVPVTGHLEAIGARGMLYSYDFGDGWRHWLKLEGGAVSDGGMYPRCVDGENACPPEDCGGESGYFRVLDALEDPDDPEHEGTKTWLTNHTNAAWPYRATNFSPATVSFDDPAKRFAYAMSNS